MMAEIDPRWRAEVRAATAWWMAKIEYAMGEAYPPETPIGVKSRRLYTPENRGALSARIADELNVFLGNHADLWSALDPIRGSMYRRVDKQGRFLHPAIGLPMVECGLGEVNEFLPDGLRCTINPGALVVGLGRTGKDIRLEVAP